MEAEDIELRSEEVQEILGKVPHWMIRVGITIVFLIIVMVLAITYFIKYPDLIPGEGVLQADEVPVMMKAPLNGQLIYFNKADTVEKGAIIAEIRNPMSVQDYQWVKHYFNSLQEHISTGGLKAFSYQNVPDSTQLGALSKGTKDLNQKLQKYEQLNTDPYYLQEITYAKEQIAHYTQLIQYSQQELNSFKRQSKWEEDQFQKAQTLYENKGLSLRAYQEEQKKWEQSRRNIQSLQKNLVQLKMSQSNAQKDYLKKTFDRNTLLREDSLAIVMMFQNLQSDLSAWKQNYLIEAPISGKLSWVSAYHLNENIQSGQDICMVEPATESYQVKAQLSSQAFAKIQEGQKVRVNLPAYPSQEYGELMGTVSKKYRASKTVQTQQGSDKIYELIVDLDADLVTNYKKSITYQPNMKANINVITEDMSLLMRFFNQFRKLIQRN